MKITNQRQQNLLIAGEKSAMNCCFRVLIYSLLVTLSAGMLAACNTTKGVGQDIEAAGEIIEDTAAEAEEELED